VDRILPEGLGDSKFYGQYLSGLVEDFVLASGKLDNVRVWFNNKVRIRPGDQKSFSKQIGKSLIFCPK
jgi:hypothetical protein